MNGSFSFPFQSYSLPSISSNQHNKYPQTPKSDYGPDISQKLLDQIQNDSINYFSKHLDSSKFRLRIPDENIAKFDHIVDSRYQDIKSSVNQSLFFTNAQPTEQYSLRHVADGLKNKRYEEVRSAVDKLFNASYVDPLQQQSFASSANSLALYQAKIQEMSTFLSQKNQFFQKQQQQTQRQQQLQLQQQLPLFNGLLSVTTLYSYLATLSQDNDDNEIEVIRQIEKLPFSRKDLVHIYHFLDELVCLPKNNHLLLTSFLLPDLSPLIYNFIKQPHVIPILSTKPTTSSLNKRIMNATNEKYISKETLEAKKRQQFISIFDQFNPSTFYQNVTKMDSHAKSFALTQHFQKQKNEYYNIDALGQNVQSMDINELMNISDRVTYDLPSLQPAVDMPIPLIISPLPKDTDKLLITLLEEKPIESVRLATTFIQKLEEKNDLDEKEEIRLSELYMKRALGFYKMNMIPAAIIDMSRSIDIDPNEMKLRARAAFYLSIGENQLSSMDEQRAFEIERQIIEAPSPLDLDLC